MWVPQLLAAAFEALGLHLEIATCGAVHESADDGAGQALLVERLAYERAAVGNRGQRVMGQGRAA